MDFHEHKHHHRRRRRRRRLRPRQEEQQLAANSAMFLFHNKPKNLTGANPATATHLPYTSCTKSDQLHLLVALLAPIVLIIGLAGLQCAGQTQQNFLLPGHNLENLRVPENTQLDTVVYQLKAMDRRNERRRFSYLMTGDTFNVDEFTGEVRLKKPLDRERQPNITVAVSVFDDLRNDEPVETKRRTIFVDDIDDSPPTFGAHKMSSPAGSAQSGPSQVYQVELSELTPVNSIVIAEISVTDADEGPNADVVFMCRAETSTNSACQVFSIEFRRLGPGKFSATVRTRQPLDYERVQAYRLMVVAKGKHQSPLRGAPLEAEATININVLNVQDEGPVFVNAPYSLSIPEGLRIGTRLLNLIVQDGDAAPTQRDLSVIVVNGPFSEYFQVNKDPEFSKIWYLETNNTIDRENPLISGVGNMFTISLLAAELDSSGMPIANETELMRALRDPSYARGTLRKENITIVVLDSPDSRPVFVHASTGQTLKDNVLVFNISESIQTGASVPNLDLAVQDMDQGINSRFNLSLMDSDVGPPASSAFALESEVIYGRSEIVLNVLNSSLLDFETAGLRSYRFNLVASKNIDPNLVQMLEMQINIMDANDNAPEFDRDQYVVEVLEGAPPGSVVTTIRAKDRDSGAFGRVDYMLRGVGANKFKLIGSEGKIIVNDCGVPQCLDYEIQPTFSLTYEAKDGGGRTKNVSVIINVIDINDHAPRFVEPIYRRELISDNLSSKQNYISPQLIVRAKDDDGPTQGRNNVTYRIRSSNLTGLEVEPSTGLVYLSQPLDLDNMIATMNTPGGSAQVSARPSSVDRPIVFEAEVVAEDDGSPRLNSSARIQLVVRGNHEGAPQFKQDLYQAFVRENQPVNKAFFQVQAIDPDDKDSQLRYSLGYDLNDLLNVNALTGELSFKEKVDYDDFKGQAYNVTVYATDNSRPYPLRAVTTVSILIQDVNDKRPKFEQHEYQATLVQGRTKRGDQVLQVNAVDSDKNSLLNYSIVADQLWVYDRNGQRLTLEDLANSTVGYLAQMNPVDRSQLVFNLKRLFSIDQRTGAVELRADPDYTFASSIIVRIRVQDLNQEVFTQSGELQMDSVLCTFFLQTHIDRSPVFAPPWSIERREYNLTMLEELSSGTAIFSLLAKDLATNTRIDTFEKVIESDLRDYFRVERSGVVLVNRRVDYEDLPAPKRLQLSVKAITGDNYFSIATLNIQVMDVNDNAPQFKVQNYSISVSESVTSAQDLLTVSADDRDSSEFGQVYYSLAGYSSDLFTIEPRKGTIRLRKSAKLDRDTEPTHSLLVTASDCNETRPSTDVQMLQPHTASALSSVATNSPGCRKSSVLVTIQLLDENDNDPVFMNVNKRGELEALVSETASIGTVIAQAIASDADEGQNGQLSYEIVRVDDLASKLIRIDRDGYISVAESLAGMGRSTPYRIGLRAYDNGKLSRQSYASLLLTISDVVSNDGVPKFVRPKVDEIVNLSESAGPGTFVCQVQAVDPDEEANGRLMYKFIQSSETFDIDPFTGVIKTQNRASFYLDREQIANYTLIVVAQDLGSPPKQAHQVLTIRIVDVNDNEPFFEREIDDPPMVLYVEEESPKDTLVGTIQAIDRDVYQNALIGYEIIEGNQNNLFRLSYDANGDSTNSTSEHPEGNNACRIYSTGRLDRELRDSYTLTIKASSLNKLRNSFLHQLRDPLGNRNPFNQYNASDLSKIRVTIRLLDLNDNRPVFVNQNAKSVVDASAEVYSQLMVFKATDADSSNSDIQYSILEVLYYSDSKSLRNDEPADALSSYPFRASQPMQAVSMRHVFDIDPRAGILRNSVPLGPFNDGYFEVFVKADSGSYVQQQQLANAMRDPDEPSSYSQLTRRPSSGEQRCSDSGLEAAASNGINGKPMANGSGWMYADMESCYVAVAKAVVFVTHQRETFRFVFNKTKLNDRLEEFRNKIQTALEEMMFEPAQAQAALDVSAGQAGRGAESLEASRAERVYLNTFNTDFYEREDGSLDFSTLTSCSQLVKFDDRSGAPSSASIGLDEANLSGPASSSFHLSQQQPHSPVSNQVIQYEKVLELLGALNASQARREPSKGSLFSQYGLVNIERCLPDRIAYRMSLAERISLYIGALIALVGALLALIASKMRKSYEKHLKLLQRSKYQYMSQPYATLGAQGMLARPAHHMSLGTLPAGGTNFIAPAYGSTMDPYDGPAYDTWQL